MSDIFIMTEKASCSGLWTTNLLFKSTLITMKKMFYLSLAIMLLIACTSKKAEEPETKIESFLYNHIPMPMDTTNSLQYKWDHKEIIASELIDGMESLENWHVVKEFMKNNIATISLSKGKVFEGKHSIKFVSPTKLPVQLPNGGRYWGRQNLIRKFDKKDFSKYNRISIQIYPDFKGFRKLYLQLLLFNEGDVPDKYGKEGTHTFMLKNNQWNKVVMEIPHLPHDKVTGIGISYGLQGNEPDAADTIVYYADNLVFESVRADYFEGWHTNNDISFTHTGYNINSKKTAFTSLNGEGKFRIIDLATNNTVLEKEAIKQTSNIGTFSVFDFSEIKTPGNYKIVYDKIESKPFPIGKDVWLPTLEKTINLFFVERCGYDQPGIHLKCHTDWYTVFKGDTIEMSGGWHDAGDLSQSYSRTAEATGIFFKLARKYQSKNEKLSKRLLEEGLWGLDWVHKNRFEGSQVLTWTVHDHYSDLKIGNFDDTPTQPGKPRGADKYYSIIADVEASLALKKINPEMFEKSRKYAIDDWEILLKEKLLQYNTEQLSIAVMAGSKLFELTGSNEVKNKTIEYADSLLKLQQKEPMKWSIPLSGFFFRAKGDDAIFGYPASFAVASPVIGLVELCKLFPGHEKYKLWYEAIRLHANYLKTIAQLTAPYYMIPANVYKLSGKEEADAQVLNGIKMDDDHYLRMFPVWTSHRGNNANILSFGIGLAAANQLLKDPEMHNIAQSQLEWIVGKNPFNQSQMYGEGYDFSPQYAVFTGDVTGGLPVGILTKGDRDVPYWKASVLHNYKEIWVHPSYRWLELLDCMDL
ncbi:MAG TPA: glycoside hydrolase family 9 protein [Prolixibacteraceae bacterium]|nr:glycoside hydrolase family 9 protein [Prolixibacteraceae bacterium]